MINELRLFEQDLLNVRAKLVKRLEQLKKLRAAGFPGECATGLFHHIEQEYAMYYDVLMTDEDRSIMQEVRQFVRDEVPSDFVRAMDREEIKYPREFVQKLASVGICWGSALIRDGEVEG